MKKTYLAWIFTGTDFYKSIIPSYFLIKKLSENFKKIYLINLENLKPFKDFHSNETKLEITEKDKRNYSFNKNVEYFYPKNKSEFRNFMATKEIIAISNLGKYFSDIYLHILLAKYKIKQIQVSFVGNLQHSQLEFKKVFRGLKYFLNKNFSYKLITILSNFGIVPKIDIRFTSNNALVNKKNLLRKILDYFKFAYVKEYILVNSKSYDMTLEEIGRSSEENITFLDFIINNVENKALRGNLPIQDYKNHYIELIKFLKKIENMFKKKVKICLHPRDDLFEKKEIFKDFEIIQHKTRENILKSALVIFFESSAIIDAVILKKKIITIYSNFLDKSIKEGSDRYKNELGILQFNISDNLSIDDIKSIDTILNNNLDNYKSYIKRNVKPDTDEPGYLKVIRILKERYFIS